MRTPTADLPPSRCASPPGDGDPPLEMRISRDLLPQVGPRRMGHGHRLPGLLLRLPVRLRREMLPPTTAGAASTRGGAATLARPHTTPTLALTMALPTHLTWPPHHSHPCCPHPRPLHLPGAAAVPRSPGRRQRDQARAAAQCGGEGDLRGPRERRRLCGSRPVRPVVNRFYTRVGAPVSPAASAASARQPTGGDTRVGTPDSPAAAARRLPPPTAAGSCGGAAGRISGATLRARGVRRGVERGA